MGNSNAKEATQLSSLISLGGILVEKKVSPTSSPVNEIHASKITFKLQVTLDDGDVIGNIHVQDKDYKSVTLVIGSSTTKGELKSGSWKFSEVVPLFLMPHGQCHLDIQTLEEKEIQYSYRKYHIDTTAKTKCSGSIRCGDRVYAQGWVY